MKREALREGKMEVAMAALKKGLSVDVVAEITELPGETVLKLKNELELSIRATCPVESNLCRAFLCLILAI